MGDIEEQFSVRAAPGTYNPVAQVAVPCWACASMLMSCKFGWHSDATGRPLRHVGDNENGVYLQDATLRRRCFAEEDACPLAHPRLHSIRGSAQLRRISIGIQPLSVLDKRVFVRLRISVPGFAPDCSSPQRLQNSGHSSLSGRLVARAPRVENQVVLRQKVDGAFRRGWSYHATLAAASASAT